jgi:hypothetical protein
MSELYTLMTSGLERVSRCHGWLEFWSNMLLTRVRTWHVAVSEVESELAVAGSYPWCTWHQYMLMRVRVVGCAWNMLVDLEYAKGIFQ